MTPAGPLGGGQRLHAPEARTSLYRAEDDLRARLSPSAADRQHRRRRDARGQDAGAVDVPVGPHGRASTRARCFAGAGDRERDHRRRRRHEHRRRTDRRRRAGAPRVGRSGGVSVLQPSVELLSFAIGGGSIARAREGRIEIGPESAGAHRVRRASAWAGASRPPPTRGSCSATSTPTTTWAARSGWTWTSRAARSRPWPSRSACRSSKRRWPSATRLRRSRPRASRAAGRDRVHELIGEVSRSQLTLVAYGGGGGLLLPGAARRLGMAATVISRHSPVFSAFGVSTFDVRHRYQQRASVDGHGAGPVVAELVDAARRDMRGEGFGSADIDLRLTVVDGTGVALPTRASTRCLRLISREPAAGVRAAGHLRRGQARPPARAWRSERARAPCRARDLAAGRHARCPRLRSRCAARRG